MAGGSAAASSPVTSPPVTSPPQTSASPPPPGGATATASGSATTVTANAVSVTVTMHGSTHEPRVGPLWPDSFEVTSAGRPATASLEYEFLLAGQVVAHRSHYTFTGHFHDTIEWPAAAVGYPLTLRAVIRARGTLLNIDYPVKVRP